jgi:ribonuclease J
MNCLAIEQADGIVVIDCGTAFPFDDHGIDVFHPEFRWLIERSERVQGVFLTHGHEDHIGGLPYLMSELDVPVWGPPHAIGMVRRRLAEHGFGPHDVHFIEARTGANHTVGSFEIEPIRVAHSIVEATALAIRTRVGTVVHSGDFNFDPAPPDGEPTDETRLREFGEEGVALLMSDSTNVDVPERPGSEREVGQALERLVREADARVFIGLFASNVQRLITIGDLARRMRRRLCLLGRSLSTQREVATQIRRLAWPSDLCIAPEQAQSFPRDELIVLAGGSQAEERSALMRLAIGTHPLLKIERGDTVILSSRAIPGNERAVFAMQNDILRLGAHLHTRMSDPQVHTSGHAGQSEQRRMIELLRPRAFMPLHGTLHHLTRHAELARNQGVREVLAVENGSAVSFDGERLRRDGEVAHGKVPIAIGGERLSPDTLRRRVELGRAGLVFVSVLLDRTRRLMAPPVVSARGVPSVDEDPHSLLALERAVARSVERCADRQGLVLGDEIRRALRRELFELSGSRPNIELHVGGES